ncbi:hypothetical protein [Methylobacterium sp. NEAU K]|uniref:hypothetical protein n=1 Tax=Methylobacterium sp. NEAU K TaxID=3064946 RepID=UPI002734C1BF|nr:hypothetical protein [Methylobacterium sp. NEAU K]
MTSQFGEDGIIKRIFEIMQPRNKWCVEFGAWDGKYLSNTWALINEEQWSGVLIEANPERSSELRNEYMTRSGSVFVECGTVGWEGDQRLDAILARTPTPHDFDLVSIDIDGNDWHVWNALQDYRPRVVVIEFNPTASNTMYFVQDANPEINQGCSLLALIELGKLKGYELIATTITNAIFVASDDYYKFEISDNTIDSMHEESIVTEICHGYDGTIFAAGHMMLNWHSVPLSQEDFQILPVSQRKYSGS